MQTNKNPIKSIVFYSDKNYEYLAKYLIESILINVEKDVIMYYYTIGFESSIEHNRLVKIPIPVDEKKPTGYRTFEFYKPNILLEHLDRFGGKALFLDTDIIVGKRFRMEFFENENDYPLAVNGNWEFPFVLEGDNVIDEQLLMSYFGVTKRSMEYVYSNIISFSESCRDFINEWKSICDNQYLLSKRKIYFPFPDETALNIVLWKRDCVNNLGRAYLNTLAYEPFEYVEENEGVKGDPNINYGIMGSDLLKCHNSSEIMLYHGIKDKSVLDKVLAYLKNKPIKTKKTYKTRLDFLEKLNEKCPSGKGVEIGVFKGEFSKEIASIWNGSLYMVDVWRPLGNEYDDGSNHLLHSKVYEEAMENIKGLEKRAIMIRADSKSASEIFADESLDFIYIDANHAYDFVVEDIKIWFPKLKKGGIFSGHDYLDMDFSVGPHAANGKDKFIYFDSKYAGLFGVNPAVDEFCKKYGYDLEATQEWLGTWWVIK